MGPARFHCTCKWVFKKKQDSSGSIKYRARLGARGCAQIQGIDYSDVYVPVVHLSTFRFLMAYSVKVGLEMYHFDVDSAFLNGNLEHDVYVIKPAGINLA